MAHGDSIDSLRLIGPLHARTRIQKRSFRPDVWIFWTFSLGWKIWESLWNWWMRRIFHFPQEKTSEPTGKHQQAVQSDDVWCTIRTTIIISRYIPGPLLPYARHFLWGPYGIFQNHPATWSNPTLSGAWHCCHRNTWRRGRWHWSSLPSGKLRVCYRTITICKYFQ